MADSSKIQFIICANDRRELEECTYYIRRLCIPQGMQIEITVIEGASSMASGYNCGMAQSNAQYRIYLHQDTCLIYTGLLDELVSIFQKDATIGMVGVVGAREIPPDVMVHSAWDIGRVDTNCKPLELNYQSEQGTKKAVFAEAIDGLFMATQYDLPWREDLFKKWDFYNAVDDHEFLEVCFSLYKGRLLFSQEDRTWWLTGFAVGEMSWPSELTMKVCVHFPNLCMRNSFIDGLLKSGYKGDKINCCGNYVCFDYCRPYNYKLNHRCRILKFFVQCMNKMNCSIYMFITRPFNTTLDKLTYLRFLAPTFYKFILHLSIPKRKHKKYQRKIKKMTARQ